MEIISGNKMCVLTANESNAKKVAIVIVTGTKITSNTISKQNSQILEFVSNKN